MKIKLLIILLMSVSLSCFAGTSSNASAAKTLTQALQNIKTFSAHFDQTITGKTGKVFSKSAGSLKIQRPGRFAWEAQLPNPLLVVADGKYIWTYDIDLEQIVKQNAKTTIIGSPAALLAGKLVNIEKDFSVQYADKSHQYYLLKPLAKDPAFNTVHIGFKNKQLVLIEIENALGQHVRTEFSDIKVNLLIDPKIFVFTPPKGVDVIINS